MGGTHIDVTTLERNHYFFWKVNYVSCISQGIWQGTKVVFRLFFMIFSKKKVCPKRDTFEKVEKKWWFRVRGAHIDVTTLERNCYFFWKVTDVFSVLHGFATPKIKKKSMQKQWYMWNFQKKVAISCGRCEHRCHHAAARDLLFERIVRCMVRFV